MKTNFCNRMLWLILISGMFTPFIACNKYLEKKQDHSLIVPSSLTDLQALLDENGLMNVKTPAQMEASSDEYFLTTEEFGYLETGSRKGYLWEPYFPSSDNDWSKSYLPVYYSNLVLELIRKVPRDNQNKEQWDNIKGSALFFRSYNFLELLWSFTPAYDENTAKKDMGIPLRQTSDFNVPSVRASNEDSYNKVIQDTKASIPLLPDFPLVRTRPSKLAAYGLLARCYLSMRKYKNALIYADSSLKLYHQLIDYNGDSDIPDGITAGKPFNQLNKETIFYTLMNGSYYSYITAEIGSIDTAIISLYDSKDLRLTAFYYDNATGHKSFKGCYGTDYMFTGITTAEMLLIRAESYIREGQVSKGLDDLNALRAKRFSPNDFIEVTTSSQQEALDLVLDERRRELVMRGLRWMDLKRLNKEGRGIELKRIIGGQTYILKPNANYYALPLPEDIIRLTGMPQNPS